MKNQVLSIEQMQKLKELGVDISKASMCYISKYPSCDFDDGDSIVVVSKDFNKRLYNEFGPTFTLQDIIELLTDDVQKAIVFINNEEYFVKCYEIKYDEENVFKIIYFDNIKQLLNACCEMLIWVAENGYLTSK